MAKKPRKNATKEQMLTVSREQEKACKIIAESNSLVNYPFNRDKISRTNLIIR